MKAEFLRHEYTWSKKSIGGSMGLGIVSSSIPKEKDQLRELEKMASMAENDSETAIPVELLMFNSQIGFVKMTVKAVAAGADKRKNKKVFLYQCADSTTRDPAVYCLPKGSWKPGNSTYLPRVSIDRPWDSSKNIFEKYHLSDRLPDLFRAVFWCVFRGCNNLAFFADWPKEDFAKSSREIMYAIHTILPEYLRRYAAYASYGCGMNQYCSFYFTDLKPENNYYDITSTEYQGEGSLEDELDHFFYEHLAAMYWENESLYRDFIARMQIELKGRELDKNVLREMQWLFLQFCIQNMIDIPSIQSIMELLPQLFYCARDSIYLEEIQDNLMEYYHLSNWSREDYEKYLNILENGITRRGEAKSLDEMNWALDQYAQRYQGIANDYLSQLSQSKARLFTKLMLHSYERESSAAQKYFDASLEDMDHMKNFINILDQEIISDDMKDRWLFQGLELLNHDIFDVKQFETFTEIADIIDRKDSWIHILRGFLEEIEERRDELNDSQLQSLGKIQNIYKGLIGYEEAPEILIEEEEGSETATTVEERIREEGKDEDILLMEDDTLHISEEKQEIPDSYEEKDKMISPIDQEEILERDHEDYEEDPEERRGAFLPFLLRSIPYGFLTGAVLFLLNYAIVIGHWKISVGVGGMWVIMLLNYTADRFERKAKDGYRLWMAIGLCIVEGYIIQTIAWLFLPNHIRVYFFLGLGALTMLIQLIQIIMIKGKQKEDVEEL